METWFSGKASRRVAGHQMITHSTERIDPVIECDFHTTAGERILEVQHFRSAEEPRGGQRASLLASRQSSYSLVDVRRPMLERQPAVAVKKSNLKSYFSSLKGNKGHKSSDDKGANDFQSASSQATDKKCNKNEIGTNKSFLTLTRLKAIKCRRRAPLPMLADESQRPHPQSPVGLVSCSPAGPPGLYVNGRMYEKFTHGSVSNERFMRLLRKSLNVQNGVGAAAQKGGSVASRRSILESDLSAYDLLEEHFAAQDQMALGSPRTRTHAMLSQRKSDTELYANWSSDGIGSASREQQHSNSTLIERHFLNPTLAKSQSNLHLNPSAASAISQRYEDEEENFNSFYDDVYYSTPPHEEERPRRPLPSQSTVPVPIPPPHLTKSQSSGSDARKGQVTGRGNDSEYANVKKCPAPALPPRQPLSTFAKLSCDSETIRRDLSPSKEAAKKLVKSDKVPACDRLLHSRSLHNQRQQHPRPHPPHPNRLVNETRMMTNDKETEETSHDKRVSREAKGAQSESPSRKAANRHDNGLPRRQSPAKGIIKSQSSESPSTCTSLGRNAGPPPLPARTSSAIKAPHEKCKGKEEASPIVNENGMGAANANDATRRLVRKACSVNGTVRMRRQDCQEVLASLSLVTSSSDANDIPTSSANDETEDDRRSVSSIVVGNGFAETSPLVGTVRIGRVTARRGNDSSGHTDSRSLWAGSEATPSPQLASDNSSLSASPSPTSPPVLTNNSRNSSNDSTPVDASDDSSLSNRFGRYASLPYLGAGSTSPPQFHCELDNETESGSVTIQKTIIDTDSQEVHYSTSSGYMGKTSKISVITTNPSGQIKDKIVIDVPLGDIYQSAIEDSICDKIRNAVVNQVSESGVNGSNSIVGDDYIDAPVDDPPVRSIFDGASKAEILEYLEDAKERVPEAIISADEVLMRRNGDLIVVEGIPESMAPPVVATKSWIECSSGSASGSNVNRRNRTSNVSNSSTDSALTSFSGASVSTNSSVDIEEEEGESDHISSSYSNSESTIKALSHHQHPHHGSHGHNLVLSSNLSSMMTSSVSVGQLVERNDSGVGVETSKPSHLAAGKGHNKLRRAASAMLQDGSVERLCADCENVIESPPNSSSGSGTEFLSSSSVGTTSGQSRVVSSPCMPHSRLSPHFPLVCVKCHKRRAERKEIISEFADTENRYYRDLLIIKHEFYNPIALAQLVSKEQLAAIFLNLEELIEVSGRFSHRLREAIDIATELGDEDFTTINIGKVFMESSDMLDSFERYCIRQATSALMLHQLEKEREMLRIFLRVSQMENNLLRRMNLSAFLMVPVQRVTKYPLLLNRLYKVTPHHHRDRDVLREAQERVGSHLQKINQHTKRIGGAPARFWRRVSTLSATLSASSRRMAKDLMGKKTL